jgi:glycosyltransferase involved in cell wall biosynthesis
MKLALIAPTPIPALTANSIQFMKMAQAFARLGHELKIYAPGTSPRHSRKQMIEHYGLSEDLDIIWLPSRLSFRRYDYAMRAVSAARRWRAEIVFTRLPQAAALSAKRGLTTIFELHDLPSGRMGPLLLNAFLRAKQGRRLIPISKALANALIDRYPLQANDNRLFVAPDAVDLERYKELPNPAEARKKLKLPKIFTVGYTGHLYAGRGIGFILDLAESLPKMHFMLVGGRREDVSRVQREIDQRKLKNLTLTGFILNADLPMYQAAADVLLMPYQTRVAASSGGNIAAFLSPMKMFEYLASARPILASDLPVLGEVLNEKNSVVLSMQDPESWLNTLKKLKTDATLREKLSASARASAENHTWESRAKDIVSGL